MHLSNAFIVLRIANMLKSTYKITSKKTRENITTQDNRNDKAKKNIKKNANKTISNITTFRVQKIMQRDNASSYH